MVDINLQVIDVALTPLKEYQINHHIGSLLRLTSNPEKAHCDVIIREISRSLAPKLVCVMVRLHATDQTYYAVGMEYTFFRAVRAVSHELQKTLSRTHVPDITTIEHLRQQAHERFYMELFVN